MRNIYKKYINMIYLKAMKILMTSDMKICILSLAIENVGSSQTWICFFQLGRSQKSIAE